eukprot:12099155-Ditylum_brightwellii.AAC.1
MENFYKPGGVLIICQGDFLTQKITEGKDYMGRWVYSKLAASDNRVITVVTAYQPCKPSKIMGTTTYHQQVVMLKQQKRSIDPRTAFIINLRHWLLECRKGGEKLILGGDFNERITPKATLMKILSDPILQLVDILQPLDEQQFSTSLTGKHRIDFLCISREITNAVERCGYNKFNQIKNTDHQGIYIDFDTQKLFGNGENKLLQHETRSIK